MQTARGLLFSHSFACVFMLRMNAVIGRRSRLLGEFFAARRYYLFANDISYKATIGPGFRIHHTSDIVIGKYATLGSHCHVYNGVTIGAKSSEQSDRMPAIGNSVTIGTGAKILGDITVGDHAVIGALTFCNKSVPAHTVAVGNPMRFLDK
jgi:serine O-acetyltransferase